MTTATMAADAVTIGESMVLFQPLQDGGLVHAPLFSKTIAGAESNVAIGLSRLGKRVRWVSRVGRDPFGDLILSTLRAEGIDLSCVVRDSDHPTGVYFKEFKGYGDPNVYYYRRGSAASHLSPTDVTRDWFTGAKLLHVSGITPALGTNTGEALADAMKLARDMGLTVSFDPNLRRKLWDGDVARKALLSFIPLCDIFLPGIDEAEFLLDSMAPAVPRGDAFLDMGPKVVVMKLGPQGSEAYTKTASLRAPAYPVQRVVDTVGAGDAFAAGFLSVWLDEWCRKSVVGESGKEKSERSQEKHERSQETGERSQEIEEFCTPDLLERALTFGNLLGGLAVQYRGDWEGLPTLAECERMRNGQSAVTR